MFADRLKCLVAVWLGAVCLAGVLVDRAVAEERPPNIVFIMADDLGWGHLGCYGNTLIETPHLDQMRREGMKFNQVYSGANVCAPARSTLMTGLHTGHTPIRANGSQRYLYDDDVTVAEVLKAAGYATGGFGKWGCGDADTPGVAVKQGFDEWFGQYNQMHAHFYYPYYLMHNLERYPLPGNEGGKRGQYAHDEIHFKALDFIRRNAERPFFAYLPYIIPHVELVVPEDSRKPYEGRFPKIALADPRPGYIGSDDAYTDYAAMISRMDRHVGEIFALLNELNIDDNTIVFFTSDNGPQTGTWAPVAIDFFRGAGPFRGGKGNFYEGGIREPMLVRWPGKIAPGSTSEHIAYFPDVMPTLAELAGAGQHVPATIDGISFVPTLLGRDGEQRQHDYLYWEMPVSARTGEGLTVALRQGDWKVIKPNLRDGWELYNLVEDIGETTNLADRFPERLEQLKSLAAAARTPVRDYGEPIRHQVSDFVR